jgi:predicted ATP-grasp superfamily ATP-dependent carboligase
MAVNRPTTTHRDTKPVVLMGFAEALAAIETAWSLRESGFRVVAFRRAGSRPALRRVRDVEIHEVPPPEADSAGTIREVQELTRLFTPAAVLPLDDQALWVCNRVEGGGTRLACATGRAADCALDKSLQMAVAREAGFAVPDTRILDHPADAGPITAPVIVKPARALYEIDGALARPTGVVCANDAELERAMARTRHLPVLVQPLIRGTGEGLFGHAGPRGVVGWSAHRRVRMVNPQGSASSACRSAPVDERLAEAAERFLRCLDWRGMFMLEFLRDSSGTPWFMELNGRAWGSMALARRCGFEYPAWTVRAALDPTFEPEPPEPSRPAGVLCRNLGLELVHLLFVARGPQSVAPMSWPSMRSTMREVFRWAPDNRLYNWNRSEPDVLVADTVDTLRLYIGRMLRSRR